jgi:hypothetical protein
MKMSRYFAWVSLISLSLAAEAPSAPAPERTPQQATPDRLTPADAEMVLTVNVRQMLQTPVVKKHALDPLKMLLKRNDELQQLLTAAGLDPLKDITTIGLSTSGNPAGSVKLLAVVRGSFDTDKARSAAEEYAKKHPGRIKSFKEGELPMWEILASAHKPFFAAFAGKNTLVMSAAKEDAVAAVRRADQPPQRINKDLQAALAQLKGSEGVWMAMTATDEIKQLLKADDTAKDFAESLQYVTGVLELNDDAQLTLVIHSSTPASAMQIKSKLDDLLKVFAFVGAGRDAGSQIVKEVLDGIKLGTEKSDVSVRVKLTDAQLEKARKTSQ